MNALFSPVSMGAVPLRHRVVMAPLTRSRAEQPGGVPGDLMVEYYGQRASDGGLIIAEASPISAKSRGWYGAPAFYSDEQVEGWKRVTGAVHAKGGRMFGQLWHTGRSAHIETSGGETPVSASVDPAYWEDKSHLVSTASGWQQPSPHRALETPEIAGIVEDYRQAAEHVKAAGFDGVELHAANGYLIDQFLQDGSNKRTDLYGGSIENRARLLLEVVETLASVWGGDRVAVRIGPSGRWNGMSDSDPHALFAYRRVHALLRRQAQETGRAAPNPKRVYRVMKVHGLLLQRDGEQRKSRVMMVGWPSTNATPAGAPTRSRSAATTARRSASPSRSTAAIARRWGMWRRLAASPPKTFRT